MDRNTKLVIKSLILLDHQTPKEILDGLVDTEGPEKAALVMGRVMGALGRHVEIQAVSGAQEEWRCEKNPLKN